MASDSANDESSDQSPQSMSFEDFEVGETYHSNGRTVTNADIRLFNGATDATHPNHVDREFSVNHPTLDLDDVVAQGVLTLSIADGFLAKTVTAQEGLIALNYGYDTVRFLDPVYPDDTISAEIEITGMEDRDEEWGDLTMEVLVSTAEGDDVLYAENTHIVAKEGFDE
jgi:acyl dehydratase